MNYNYYIVVNIILYNICTNIIFIIHSYGGLPYRNHYRGANVNDYEWNLFVYIYNYNYGY